MMTTIAKWVITALVGTALAVLGSGVARADTVSDLVNNLTNDKGSYQHTCDLWKNGVIPGTNVHVPDANIAAGAMEAIEQKVLATGFRGVQVLGGTTVPQAAFRVEASQIHAHCSEYDLRFEQALYELSLPTHYAEN